MGLVEFMGLCVFFSGAGLLVSGAVHAGMADILLGAVGVSLGLPQFLGVVGLA